MIYTVREDQVIPLLDNYISYMNAKDKIPNKTRIFINDFLQLIIAKEKLAELKDSGDLYGEDKLEYLNYLKFKLVEVLCSNESDDFYRCLQLFHLCSISGISVTKFQKWLRN